MSGLFLNVYQVELASNETQLGYLDYNDYGTKEAYAELRKGNPDDYFYRYNNKIFLWPTNDHPSKLKAKQELVKTSTHPKVFSRLIATGIISYLQKSNTHDIDEDRFSNSWDIKSRKDLLLDKIPGLKLNRVVTLSPFFFETNGKIIFTFSLSTSLKNKFIWSKAELEKNSIDTTGLRGTETTIYANRQSLKRFLEATGKRAEYDQVIDAEGTNTKAFLTIDQFYSWIKQRRDSIRILNQIQISDIKKRFLPFENEAIKSEIIYKPVRYFYSNRKNNNGLKFYDEMVRQYKPYSYELYENKDIKLGLICPREYQGESEIFLKQLGKSIKDDFHVKSISYVPVIISNRSISDYKKAIYDNQLQQCNVVLIVVSLSDEKLAEQVSPYHVCKAKLIGIGIPTQDIQIETIRPRVLKPVLTNISLNIYAKLGGTAWTIEREEKIREELVIGVGSTISEDRKHILGIAQVFHNDGRYIMGDCSPLSTYDNYAEHLEEYLYKTLSKLVWGMAPTGKFRLIFHLFKTASEEYEITAINKVIERFSKLDFEYALVHLGYGHNFRLYNNNGNSDIIQGRYIKLGLNSALLHFVRKSCLPLKIDLDKRSTFTSLFYLAKQIFWFSHLSHRSYIPSKRTVTIMYPALMAKVLDELKKVEGWDYDRLKYVSDKLWFI